MNKNAYRIIFSHARGMFIAVAEIVKSRCKTAGQSSGTTLATEAVDLKPITYKKLNPLNFAVIGLLGASIYTLPLASVANTQIIADKGAPTSQQPTILNSGNGLVQVNIQTPSAGGVSRNTYTQFDVGQEGAILNNARNNTQTQIGGWVQGNPWLAKGEAKVILNEVNSANPSQLKGYLEVAGKQAQVVIANPSGLVCDGCGVINADRFSLTTGQAVVNQGYLESFRVREGQVTISGKGLDGSQTPFTDIYSRALTVNAGLYANQLNAVLGVNDINVKDQTSPQFTAVNPTTTNTAQFSLDVGQMGGMYAGKIFLVGNEHGLGMRNAGSINATKEKLTLTSSGDLINAGNIIANKDQIALQANNINNSGNISSSQNKITLQTKELRNSGLIATTDELEIKADGDINNNNGVLNAGRLDFTAQNLSNEKGKIEQTGQQQLQLIAKTLDNSQGAIGQASQSNTGTGNTPPAGEVVPPTVKDPSDQSSAHDGSTVEVVKEQNQTPKVFEIGKIQIAAHIDNISGSIINNDGIVLQIQDRIQNNGGEIQVAEFQFTGDNFDNQQGKFYGDVINIDSKNINNQQGLIDVRQQLSLNAQQLNNAQGVLQSSKKLNIQAVDVNNNHGKILAVEQLELDAAQVNNKQGIIASINHNADLNVAQFNNAQGEISAKQLNIQSENLDNSQGQLLATGQADLHVSQQLNNSKGLIGANQKVNIDAYALNNSQGAIRSKDDQLQIKSQSALDNTQGEIYAKGAITLNTQGLSNVDGVIVTDETLQIDTQQQQLENSQGKLIAKDVNILSGSLVNQAGLVLGKNSVLIDTQQHDLINTDAGEQSGILSQGSLKVKNVSQLDNRHGLISAVGESSIGAQTLNNTAGEISSQNNLTIQQLQSQGALNNQTGKILAEKNLTLKFDQINNQGLNSLISAGETLQIDASQIDNRDTKKDTINSGINAKNIALTADVLNNQFGSIFASKSADLNVKQQLKNQKGSLIAIEQLQIGDQGQTLDIDNTAGELLAKDLIKIQANALQNNGTIASENNVDIGLKQDYTHSQSSQIVANNQLKLTTDKDVINQAELTAGKRIDITAQNINNQKGATIYSEETHLTAKDTLHNQGLINGELTHIQADRVWNDGAHIYGTEVAIAAKTLDNMSDVDGNGAIIASRGDMNLAVGTLNNQASGTVKKSAKDNAWILSQGNLSIGGELDDQLKAQGQAGQINNNSARIESLGDMKIDAVKVNNINSNFKTEIVQVGDIVNKTYIQPKGTNTKILASELHWQNWSRAGLYRYNTNPTQLPENIILGETPIPNVESMNCVDEGDAERCQINYKKDDQVWAYFNIAPPAQDAPNEPTVIAPEVPTGQNSCEIGAGYDAVACKNYEVVKAQYDLDKKAYDKTIFDYETALLAWENADESAYQLLDEAIENYNRKFGSAEIKAWTEYKVNEKTSRSQIVESTAGEIIAGGSLDVSADWFINDKSQVLAGKTLKYELANDLVNLDGEGVEILNQTGTSQYTTSRWRGGFKRYHQRDRDSEIAYNPADQVETITLPVALWLGDTQNHTLNTQIDSLQTTTNNTIQAGNSNQPVVDGTHGQGEQPNISGDKVDQANQVRSVDLDKLQISSNALFSVAKDSQAQYLVESDPAFTNYKQWLSTDYMLKAMGADPTLAIKRLGDGYYEQRLVQDQIAQLTGKRFLDGYANDEKQYQALMNSGLSFAKNYGLKPGVALTAAQIAQLTSDIVWIEEKQVTLADGSIVTAWVPQVYVRAREGDLRGDGSLMSAEQVDLQVKGGVINSATIAGRDIVKISADHINQLGGRIESNLVNLKTTKDLNNEGGVIVAHTAASLDVGGDFNHRSTTQIHKIRLVKVALAVKD